MSVFVLPDLGEGLSEAEIVSWHVASGDHVVADQPLLSVETDKAMVEIPAPTSGRVAAIVAAVGEVVAVGAPLLELAPLSSQPDAGSVVGTLPRAHAATSVDADTDHASAATAARVHASPAVRGLAVRLGVDLSRVAASGPDATITRADVEAAASTGGPDAHGAPLRGVRRTMARNMSAAHAQIVPATLTDEVDVHDWAAGTDITLRLVRALGVACAEEPALNAWFTGSEGRRQLHSRVDVGLAMDTEDGLFVPVLRDVRERDDATLRAGLEQMKSDVLARTVATADMRGATITLSNFGTLGGLHAALVVMPPQVAIVGAGRVRECVVPRQGAPVIRRVLPLSLTFDHRAVTGGEAARFMSAMRRDLESGA